MHTHWSFWIGFHVVVLALLALDLGLLNRNNKEISTRKALGWTASVIALALVFNTGIYWIEGHTPAVEFLTAYLIEQSLSMDNVFVFAVIFKAFAVPRSLQHRVLFYGVLGAIIMRALFIFAGVALFSSSQWAGYLFGAFLIFTAVKMLLTREEAASHPEDNILVRLSKKYLRAIPEFSGNAFMVKKEKALWITPLLLALLTVEFTDLIFAMDSIPAVLAISQDIFIVYTSNIFAILALRSLYFAISGLIEKFYLLHYALAVILAFVGAKLLLSHYYLMPTAFSLGIILICVAGAIAGSLLFPKKESI